MNNFIKTLDKSEMGIVRKMQELNLLLKEKDPQLWAQLVRRLYLVGRPLYLTFMEG